MCDGESTGIEGMKSMPDKTNFSGYSSTTAQEPYQNAAALRDDFLKEGELWSN
jgi:hypothetical protein